MDNNQHKDYNLEFIIFSILSGQNEYKIAKMSGLPVKTIREITESENFKLLYNDILECIKKRITDKLDVVFDKAINRLSEILDSAENKDVLEACKIIFNSKSTRNPLTAIQINTNSDTKIKQNNSLTELIIQKRKERNLPTT